MSLPPNSSDNQLGGNNQQQSPPQNSTTSVDEFSPPTTEQLNMRCTGFHFLFSIFQISQCAHIRCETAAKRGHRIAPAQ
jgi:hypothetical protein